MIYLDTNVLIRWIEGDSITRTPIETKLAALKSPEPFIITCRLSRLECRVKPLRDSNTNLLQLYEKLFNSEELRLTEIHSAVIERATELRSQFNLKTPDAIHLASAIVEGCQSFLTGDKQLGKITLIDVQVV